jgi:hypothetical protein
MTMAEDLVVPLRSRRQQRAVLVQKLQHAIPGFVLLMAGLETLGHGPHGTELGMAIFEIAASVLLLGSMARTLHSNRHLLRRSDSTHHPHVAHRAHRGIEWADLFAAAVLIAEGLERKMHGHHFPRPAILAAATLAVMGLMHGRLQHFAQARRSLRVTDDALFVPGRPFKVRRLHATWADLRSIEVGERWAVIRTRAGRVRKLDLADLEGESHVRSALLHARQLLTERTIVRDTAE